MSFWLLLAALSGCMSAPPTLRTIEPDLTLEEAKGMMHAGRVREIYQPHEGCVVMFLKNGSTLTFEQPYLDWVYGYVREQGLEDRIRVWIE